MNHIDELRKLLDAQKLELQRFSRKFYFIAVALLMTSAFAVTLWPKPDLPPSWHEEIFSSNAISYIRDGELVALPDGDYPLAMPPEGTFVDKIAPLLLVQVDGNWYPLNIADDSVIPRHGKLLTLKILFGFTSAHAENTLKYNEKTGNDARADYRKKAIYYLEVKGGYGRVQRSFEIKDLPRN